MWYMRVMFPVDLLSFYVHPLQQNICSTRRITAVYENHYDVEKIIFFSYPQLILREKQTTVIRNSLYNFLSEKI